MTSSHLDPRFGKHAVLEVKSFGDLLPNVLCRGQDTYAAELCAFASTASPVAALASQQAFASY